MCLDSSVPLYSTPHPLVHILFDIGECMVYMPCVYRACMNNFGSFSCNCDGSYTGQLCDEDIDECEGTKPCLNGRTCLSTEGSLASYPGPSHAEKSLGTRLRGAVTMPVPLGSLET